MTDPPVAHPLLPRCPKCGSEDGSLGTSFAYFICHQCKREQYWTLDHEHPGDWNTAIEASPWAVVRRRIEQRGQFQVTVEQAADEIQGKSHID
jgi:tRNA(Ile2) C34 agmatinyltransferase TiaS